MIAPDIWLHRCICLWTLCRFSCRSLSIIRRLSNVVTCPQNLWGLNFWHGMFQQNTFTSYRLCVRACVRTYKPIYVSCNTTLETLYSFTFSFFKLSVLIQLYFRRKECPAANRNSWILELIGRRKSRKRRSVVVYNLEKSFSWTPLLKQGAKFARHQICKSSIKTKEQTWAERFDYRRIVRAKWSQTGWLISVTDSVQLSHKTWKLYGDQHKTVTTSSCIINNHWFKTADWRKPPLQVIAIKIFATKSWNSFETIAKPSLK